MHRIAAVVAGLSLAFVGTSTAFSATIYVPEDYATIQGAINASVNGDVISIAAGTYNEHSLNPNGKAITIGSASGNLDVTIDAQQGGSVFVINSGEGNGTVIQDLVITGGYASGTFPANCGGGIRCFGSSTPTISGCTISGNTADLDGGGIYCNVSSPAITDSTISDNTGYRGGGIYCTLYSNASITNCTISDNMADSSGGGIYCANNSNNGNVMLIDTYFCANEPDQTNGSWTSGGGNTLADDCPDGGGACCVTSGCTALYETQCAEMGGTWLGEGASCDDCAPTCPGDANADGTVDVFDLLKVIDGWGICP